MNDMQREQLLQLIKQYFPNGNTKCFGSSAKWEEVSKTLNNLGSEKTVDQWKIEWENIKTYVQSKIQRRRTYRDENGSAEFPTNLVLSEEDRIVISICGVISLNGYPKVGETNYGQMILSRVFDVGDIPFLDSTDSDISSEERESPNIALNLQKEMVDLQKSLNELVQKMTDQQTETNKYLEQIVDVISGHYVLLQEHFVEQKEINSRLAAQFAKR